MIRAKSARRWCRRAWLRASLQRGPAGVPRATAPRPMAFGVPVAGNPSGKPHPLGFRRSALRLGQPVASFVASFVCPFACPSLCPSRHEGAAWMMVFIVSCFPTATSGVPGARLQVFAGPRLHWCVPVWFDCFASLRNLPVGVERSTTSLPPVKPGARPQHPRLAALGLAPVGQWKSHPTMFCWMFVVSVFQTRGPCSERTNSAARPCSCRQGSAAPPP